MQHDYVHFFMNLRTDIQNMQYISCMTQNLGFSVRACVAHILNNALLHLCGIIQLMSATAGVLQRETHTNDSSGLEAHSTSSHSQKTLCLHWFSPRWTGLFFLVNWLSCFSEGMRKQAFVELQNKASYKTRGMSVVALRDRAPLLARLCVLQIHSCDPSHFDPSGLASTQHQHF